MAVKKASVKDLADKVAAAKKADAKKADAKKEETKAAAPVKKEAAPVKKAAPAKKETAVKKTTPAKKTSTAKKPAAKTSPVVEVHIQYQGGDELTSALTERAIAESGNKNPKEVNLYVQPENGKVYYTIDGVEGSFDYQ